MDSTFSTELTIASHGVIAFAAATMLFAALHDVAFRTVPNCVSAALLAAGLCVQVMDNTILSGLTAGSLVFLGAVFCWRRGWLGGGDVKLLAAAAVLVPAGMAVNLLLDVALAGGVLAVTYLLLARMVTPPSRSLRPSGLLQRICRAERYRMSRRGPLPYASAIAAGAFLVLLKG
jgi:prepilin peptidase CpaA